MEVSVIIPTHNRINDLINAVESVCNQTIKPNEIIVVDDASSSPVKDALKKIKTKGVTIKCERFSKSQGACSARNRGAEIANGNILMFLDDDDTWEPQKVEKQLGVLKKNPQVGLVYSGRKIVSDSNRNIVLFTIPPTKKGILYPQILYKNFIGTTSSVAIKKELFFKVGGFDTDMPALQDYDLWIRCCRSSIVDFDDGCNVRYTVADDPSKQISGRKTNHEKAIKLIEKKYKQEMRDQGFVGKRKIMSSLYFYVAKSQHKTSYWRALHWSIQSFFQFPNSKALILLAPRYVINKVRRRLG